MLSDGEATTASEETSTLKTYAVFEDEDEDEDEDAGARLKQER